MHLVALNPLPCHHDQTTCNHTDSSGGTYAHKQFFFTTNTCIFRFPPMPLDVCRCYSAGPFNSTAMTLTGEQAWLQDVSRC